VDADDDRDRSLRNIGPAGNGEGMRGLVVELWYCPTSLSRTTCAFRCITWSRLGVLKSGCASADAIFNVGFQQIVCAAPVHSC